MTICLLFMLPEAHALQDAMLAFSGNLWLPALLSIDAAASLGTAATLAPSPPPAPRPPPPPPAGDICSAGWLEIRLVHAPSHACR